jgi:hypothetical protein
MTGFGCRSTLGGGDCNGTTRGSGGAGGANSETCTTGKGLGGNSSFFKWV